MNYLKETDVELYEAIELEAKRQRDHIELIASENYVSSAVMQAVGSILTNKYAEGKPGKRYYGGCEFVDVVESLAIERAKQLFGCEAVNVQPHSGANANLIAFYALLEPGDTIMGMGLDDGGHLTHGTKMNISGKFFNSVPYSVDKNTELLNYDAILEQAMEVKPKLIVCGASAYSQKIDFAKFKEIADACGAYLMADISHIAGLVIAGEHQNPVPYCDIVTTTTHKTLRGTRGGIVMCKKEWEAKVNSATFPGIQGGPLMHVIAGKAAAFKEALTPEYKQYQHQVVLNASAMADEFKKLGMKLVANGTQNHLMILDLSKYDLTGKDLEVLLDKCNITTNKNTLPNETKSTFLTSGLRVGAPAMTTRGLKEEDFRAIANLIVDVIENRESAIERVKEKAIAICQKFPLAY